MTHRSCTTALGSGGSLLVHSYRPIISWGPSRCGVRLWVYQSSLNVTEANCKNTHKAIWSKWRTVLRWRTPLQHPHSHAPKFRWTLYRAHSQVPDLFPPTRHVSRSNQTCSQQGSCLHLRMRAVQCSHATSWYLQSSKHGQQNERRLDKLLTIERLLVGYIIDK